MVHVFPVDTQMQHVKDLINVHTIFNLHPELVEQQRNCLIIKFFRYSLRMFSQPCRRYVSSLTDRFGRRHNYLRVSLTEKCNLRCRYCMPAEGIKLAGSSECLQLEELKRLTSVFVERCGVSKIRLTGGEPTVSKNMIPLLRHMNLLRSGGLQKVAITTNGLRLLDQANVLENLGKLRIYSGSAKFC